jgi:outer membrane receptor protein involved in Fe transport
MKNPSAPALVCGLLLLSPCAAAAQSENTEHVPEKVIVTGTRLAGQESDSNVSVIDAGTIAARDPASAVDLLRDLPGVFVQQSGGRGSVVSLFTRGAKPNFTLVLLDGVKANDPTNTRGGSYDFSTLDMNDIERIEFVRGPASAIYGSDAVGGVINIITRHGSATPEAGLSAEGGSFGYARIAGHVSGPIGGATANLGLSYTDSGMPVQGSNVKGTNLDGAVSLPQIAGISIDLTGRYDGSIATSFPDSSGGPGLSILRSLDHRDIDEGVLGAHAHRSVTDWWQAALDYGFYSRGADVTSPGVASSAQTPTGIPANGDLARFTRHEVTFTNRLTPLPGLDAAIGMDVQAEHGVDDGYLQFGPAKLPTHFALNRTIWAGFAEARYQLTPALSLSGSTRYDATSSTDHVSPQGHPSADVLGQSVQAAQLLFPGQSHRGRSHPQAGGSRECGSRLHPVPVGFWPVENGSLCHQLSRPDRFPPRCGAQAGQSFHRAYARHRDLTRSHLEHVHLHPTPVLYQCAQPGDGRCLARCAGLAGRRHHIVAADAGLGCQPGPQSCGTDGG